MFTLTPFGLLLGGFITDAINWRRNFIALPFAVVAVIMIQKPLHLPEPAKRKVSIDCAGIVLLAGVSPLLIWSQAGHQFEWASATTAWTLSGAAAALVAFTLVH